MTALSSYATSSFPSSQEPCSTRRQQPHNHSHSVQRAQPFSPYTSHSTAPNANPARPQASLMVRSDPPRGTVSGPSRRTNLETRPPEGKGFEVPTFQIRVHLRDICSDKYGFHNTLFLLYTTNNEIKLAQFEPKSGGLHAKKATQRTKPAAVLTRHDSQFCRTAHVRWHMQSSVFQPILFFFG